MNLVKTYTNGTGGLREVMPFLDREKFEDQLLSNTTTFKVFATLYIEKTAGLQSFLDWSWNYYRDQQTAVVMDEEAAEGGRR